LAAKIIYKQREIYVCLDGEIDHHSASLIRVSIDEAVSRKRPLLLVLDFDKVTFMDSSGIALVMGRVKNMQAVSGNVKVRINDVKMAKILTMSGMDKYVEFI